MQKSKLFEEASQYSQEHLREELVPARLDELYAAMANSKELYDLLTTKAKNLPPEYLMLVDELTPDIENETLLSVIKTSIKWSIRGTMIKSFFSKAGEKLLGFAAYVVNIRRNEVDEIKIFSFNTKRPSPVLIRDLKGLLENLLQQYPRVSWTSKTENPANKIYQQAIDEFKGTKTIKDEIIFYTIERV